MKRNNKKTGYTIIETMISVALFVIIIMTGMGALLNANLIHQKSRDMRSIMDNLNFVMEDMSKNLRTGYSYHCFVTGENIPGTTSNTMSVPKSCASGWAIAFEPAGGTPSNDGISDANDNDQWVYYVDNTGKIFRSTQGPYIASSFIQLTPDEVVIDATASNFSVLGAEPPPESPGPDRQPFVTIKLSGEITFKDVVTPFSLQTSVSQRNIDL